MKIIEIAKSTVPSDNLYLDEALDVFQNLPFPILGVHLTKNQRMQNFIDLYEKLAEGEAASIQKDIDFVNDLIMKDIFPWGRLLNTLEVKMPNGVILESFTTSKDFTKVQLKGSAESMKNVGSFLTNLDEALIYRDNRLINLSIDQEDIPQDDMDNTSMPIKYEIESTIDLEQLLKR